MDAKKQEEGVLMDLESADKGMSADGTNEYGPRLTEAGLNGGRFSC